MLAMINLYPDMRQINLCRGCHRKLQTLASKIEKWRESLPHCYHPKKRLRVAEGDVTPPPLPVPAPIPVHQQESFISVINCKRAKFFSRKNPSKLSCPSNPSKLSCLVDTEELVSRFMLVVFRRTGATNYVNLLLYNQIYLPTSIPAALYHEQKHNRTVGLRSGKGRRKAMDYVNELLNGNLIYGPVSRRNRFPTSIGAAIARLWYLREY